MYTTSREDFLKTKEKTILSIIFLKLEKLGLLSASLVLVDISFSKRAFCLNKPLSKHVPLDSERENIGMSSGFLITVHFIKG